MRKPQYCSLNKNQTLALKIPIKLSNDRAMNSLSAQTDIRARGLYWQHFLRMVRSSAWFSHSAPAVLQHLHCLQMLAYACHQVRSHSHELVEKARSGVVVKLKEFLGDNTSLLNELGSVGGQATVAPFSGTHKPRLQDISSLTLWLYCSLADAALRCADKETREGAFRLCTPLWWKWINEGLV